MIVVSFPIGETEYSIFVALEEENLKRMASNDPAEVNIPKVVEGAGIKGRTLKDIIIASPSKEDLAKAIQLINAGEPKDALRFLSRGFTYKPEEGDNDRPYDELKLQ